MKYVEIYKLNNDGSQSVIATCILEEDGTVSCSGDEVLVENLKNGGIKNYAEPDSLLFFKDGLKFLEQLKFNFNSGYINGSDIMEK